MYHENEEESYLASIDSLTKCGKRRCCWGNQKRNEEVNKQGWTILIKDPRINDLTKMVRVKLANRGLASSGDYQQYFIHNNVNKIEEISPFSLTKTTLSLFVTNF